MPRWPTGTFELRRTSCYGCVRMTPSDGSCGVHGYPCIHYGMDLFAKNREVVAPEAGVVVAVADGSSPPWTGYGPGVVVIQGQGTGKFLLMSHLERGSIMVGKGDRVSEGQQIARFDADIAHTHFEVRKNLTGPSKDNTINPKDWVRGISLVMLVGLGIGAWWITRWWSSQTT